MLHILQALRSDAVLPNPLNNKDKAITVSQNVTARRNLKNLTNFECQGTFRGFLPNRPTWVKS